MTLDECEGVARRVAMSLPPSDFGSTRAIQAFARALLDEICKEREACADVALNACLVPPDGGSPTEEDRLMCERAADLILARSVPSDLPFDARPF
jgi:hypothetical protein